VEKFYAISQPIPAEALDDGSREGPIGAFIDQTDASIVVPLLSSGRVVGVLTVGSDRSGQRYDWDTLQFLGVLAKHAAGEFHKMDLLSTLVEAKETDAFKTFSTFLLHDLKNFASTLSLIAKNASQHQGNPDFQRDAFRSVFETAEKMKKLCNSLGTFSTTLATHKKLENLSQIARSVAASFSTDLGSRLALDLGEVPLVMMDREVISRVLQNLLLNAREAISPEGSITLRTRSHDGLVEVLVEDNGRGMTREFLERGLFLPFHTTKSDGLGIGLFQSKKIVEAHQGTIRVESAEGKGTIVHLYFPVAAPARAREAGAKAD
jgi:putative PEP-CTERM system histidine kinase